MRPARFEKPPRHVGHGGYGIGTGVPRIEPGAGFADFSAPPRSAFGDAAHAADAIMAVAAMDEPPLRLAIGTDAVEGIRKSLRSRLAVLDRWESFSPAPVEETV